MKALVMLVEDDVDLGATVTEILEEAGYQVARACDGAEALEVLARGPRPALILLDLGLPRMDGRAFRIAQLASPEWAKIPTVILSGDEALDPVAELGAAAGLRKPITFEALIATIGAHAA